MVNVQEGQGRNRFATPALGSEGLVIENRFAKPIEVSKGSSSSQGSNRRQKVIVEVGSYQVDLTPGKHVVGEAD